MALKCSLTSSTEAGYTDNGNSSLILFRQDYGPTGGGGTIVSYAEVSYGNSTVNGLTLNIVGADIAGSEVALAIPAHDIQTRFDIVHSCWRIPQLDRTPFGSADLDEAKCYLSLSGLQQTTTTISYAWYAADPGGGVFHPERDARAEDAWFKGTMSSVSTSSAISCSMGLCAVLERDGAPYPYPIWTSGVASTISSGGYALFDSTDFIKAYLDWRGQALGFEWIIIPGTGFEITPANAGTEAALEDLMMSSVTNDIAYSYDPSTGISDPNLPASIDYWGIGDIVAKKIEWTGVSVSALSAKFNGTWELPETSRVFYGLPRRQDEA